MIYGLPDTLKEGQSHGHGGGHGANWSPAAGVNWVDLVGRLFDFELEFETRGVSFMVFIVRYCSIERSIVGHSW